MTDTILPVKLNQGLDLVTPPLLIKEGALIDCLNYELTDISGYRRIDGYERFDGYPDGDIAQYYQLSITATIPGNQVLIIPGSVVMLEVEAPPGVDWLGDTGTEDAGVIVHSSGGIVYRYVPFEAINDITVGSAVVIRTPSGTEFDATVTVAPVNGKTVDTDVDDYIANIRAYSAVLRGLVVDAPGKIAGLWRLDDVLYAAVDAKDLEIDVSVVGGPHVVAGMLIRHKGIIYRVLDTAELERTDSPSPGERRLILMPVDTSPTVNNDVTEIDSSDNSIVVMDAAVTQAASDTSHYAYVVEYNEVRTSDTRGHTPLAPVVRVPFDVGSYTSEFLPLDSTVSINNGGSISIQGIIRHVQVDSGSFLSGNATGYMHIEIGTCSGGSRILDNYEISLDFGTTQNALVDTNGGFDPVTGPKVAGTSLLTTMKTRYVAVQGNFTGSIDTRAAYATNGVKRCVWNDSTCFGTVVANPDEDLDNPKYVAFHVGKLALGYAQGSVLLSVQGEPHNYAGLQGAIEIATGDPVTGLLEMPGETLAVFGRRAIRKITGFTDTDTQLGSLASGASCFDYTAVLVGQTAIYTGVHGITSLSQTASYGDFVGERLSDPISVWLRPRLVATFSTIEEGGVVCAIPVRSKQQYRLFLKTGEVVILTLTSEGPRLTLANYGLDGDIRIPFAWNSDTLDNGQERMHVRWDAEGEEYTTYSLDRGWGFDGEYFNHYFDTAHVFLENGTHYTGVEKIRLFGQGYGVATLNIKSSGIEEDFDQDYHTAVQDISMPPTPYTFYDRMKPVTSIVDQANWGMGIKLRIANTTEEGSANTEPSHLCQILVLYMRSKGIGDN